MDTADVFTKSKRSEVMSRIHSSGNRETELALIRVFHERGITGWRRQASLFGKPDFIFAKLRLAVFVDGCFWHGCPMHSTIPVGNRAFWERKLVTNKLRDRLVNRTLRAKGWKVLRIWEHELSRKQRFLVLRKLRRIGLLSP